MLGNRYSFAFAAGLLLSACSPDTIDKDGTLVVTVEPGFVYAGPPNDTEPDCVKSGGAVVSVFGAQPDGTPAESATVEVWLSSSTEGAFRGQKQSTSVKLGSDGFATGLCFQAGETPGTVTVNARSGPVNASSTIDVRERLVPTGGQLMLTVSPITSSSQRATAASSCGEPEPAGCVSGTPRKALVSVIASVPMGGVPSSALVTLSAGGLGWLSASGDCTETPELGQIQVPLTASAATATWCFPDFAGTGNLTASSGGVSATAHVTVPAIPASLVAFPSVAHPKQGDPLTLTAYVTDCAGNAVAGVPVAFQTSTGDFELSGGSVAVSKTSSDGVVTVSGTIAAVPLAVTAKVIGSEIISCPLTVAP